jgi:hypothetical protein
VTLYWCVLVKHNGFGQVRYRLRRQKASLNAFRIWSFPCTLASLRIQSNIDNHVVFVDVLIVDVNIMDSLHLFFGAGMSPRWW